MKIKTSLTLQSIWIVIGTLIFTIIAVLIYSSLYEGKNRLSVLGASESLVVVLEGEKPIHVSEKIDDSSLRELIMNLKLDEKFFDMNGIRYSVSTEMSNIDNAAVNVSPVDVKNKMTVVKLTPSVNVSDGIRNLMLITIAAFALSFAVASTISSHHNKKHIVEPITELKDATDRISSGDLDTVVSGEGDLEIRNLFDSVEKLRVKLCESVYFREKSDENRKFLISGISHDLRTPVTAIRGYIEGVIDGVASTEEKRNSYLHAAIEKTDTVKIMIEDLLLYSKLDFGQIPFEIEKVKAANYIAITLIGFASDYSRQHKSISFEDETDGSDCIRIDCNRFSRVLQNILDNAAKNIEPETGSVQVFLRKNASSVIIEIKDNGKGIPREMLPHIFDRFYRGDPSRKNDGGSGLGLTIAKQMVEGMGGMIWAASREGEGTSILISFKADEKE